MKMSKRVGTILLTMMIMSLLDGRCKALETNDITCAEAGRILLPRIPYLQGSGPGKPSAICCSAAKTVFKGASSTKTRRALCQCFKQAAPILRVNPDRSKQLPKLCNIPYHFLLTLKLIATLSRFDTSKTDAYTKA